MPAADVLSLAPPLEHVIAWLNLLVGKDDVVELRALDVQQSNWKPYTESGFFDGTHLKEMAGAARLLTRAARGVYWTLNPLNPDLLSRRCNRVGRADSGSLASDRDVVHRNWFLTDIDPVRTSGVSSSEAEKADANDVMELVRQHLRSAGWPEPILADSGNGWHLLYSIDLPADDGGLVKNCLQALARRFDDGSAKVDTSVFNPARICKLYGTLSKKGDSTPDRPHRYSQIVEIPSEIKVVSLDLLLALASEIDAAAAPPALNDTTSHTDRPDDVLVRAGNYLSKVPAAVSGDQGHNRTFHAACVLVRDFALAPEEAFPLFAEWNQRCQPPWSESELRHKLRDAEKLPGPRGAKLVTNDAKSISPTCARTETSQNKPTEGVSSQPSAPEREFVPFPTEVLPDPVRSYIGSVGKALGCDESLVALPLLAALASAVGNTRRIRLKSSWSEPCVFWVVTVAPSGALKSPALDAAMHFIRKRQDAAIRAWKLKMEEFARDKNAFDADLAEWKKKGRKAGEPPPDEPAEPVPERFICEDTTVEALAVRLEDQPRGLLMLRDELSGWVNSFDAYKSARGADVAHWLSMHRAGSLIVDRKTGRKLIYVQRAAVSIAGGVQPGALRAALAGRYRSTGHDEAMSAAPAEHFENGLAARLLFAMPPRRPKRWTDTDVDPSLVAAVGHVFEELASLQFRMAEGGDECPVDLDLTAEGKRAWVKFYDEHADEQILLDGDIESAWSKLEGYTARFALLIHLIRWASSDDTLRNPNLIDEVSVATGIALSRWFGYETTRVYELIGQSGVDDPLLLDLVRLVRERGGRMTVRQLARTRKPWRDDEDRCEKDLQSLADAKLGKWVFVPPGERGGRPTRAFLLGSGDVCDETRPDHLLGAVSDLSQAEKVGFCEADQLDVAAFEVGHTGQTDSKA